MKKYLFIVLFVGVCFGQDGLFSKFKSKYPKLYCSECDLTMKQTIGGFVCVDGHTRIEKSAFMKDEDGNYYLPTKGTTNTYDDKEYEVRISNEDIQTAENHLDKAGNHLQSFMIRQLYAIGFANLGFYLLIKSPDDNLDGLPNDNTLLKIRILNIAAAYNFISSLIEVNEAGKELKKASKSIRK